MGAGAMLSLFIVGKLVSRRRAASALAGESAGKSKKKGRKTKKKSKS